MFYSGLKISMTLRISESSSMRTSGFINRWFSGYIGQYEIQPVNQQCESGGNGEKQWLPTKRTFFNQGEDTDVSRRSGIDLLFMVIV